jgi:hypothetical protein
MNACMTTLSLVAHRDEAVSISAAGGGGGGGGKYSVERENVSVAAAVCRHLQVSVDGMRSYYWPCRCDP